MDHLNILFFSLTFVMVLLAVTYGIYKVVSTLYLNFLDFSRRFRGVE